MKKFVFIRHGLSTSNRDRIISGNLDVPLSEEGVVLLKELQKKDIYPITDIYVSSPLTRCIDTFNIIHNDKRLDMTNDLFKEICYGKLQGTSPESGYLDEYFMRLFSNEVITENELYSDFVNRITKGVKETYRYLEKNNLSSASIVCHSTVIKSIVHKIKSIPLNEIRNVKIGNGLGIIVNVDLVDDEIFYYDLEEIKG